MADPKQETELNDKSASDEESESKEKETLSEKESHTIEIKEEKPSHTEAPTQVLVQKQEEKPEITEQPGLTSDQVKELQAQYGWNETIQKKPSFILNFLKKFWGPTPVMLVVTSVIAFVLKHWATGAIIMVLLILNAIIAFVQQKKSAVEAVEALKKNLQIYARVKRDGKWESVPSRELVPSDIVRLRVGDLVPADVTVFKGSLDVDESAMTGEPRAAHKEKNDEIYAGSIIASGEATVIVSRTGAQTFFGSLKTISTSAPKLHSQSVISKFVYALVTMVIVLLIVAFLVNALVLKQSPLAVLPLVLILLISSFRVSLPTMFTVTMSLDFKAVKTLANQGILVTRLNAAEDAASMSVLCLDKTGTLTKNKLSIVNIKTNENFEERDVLFYGCLASKLENQDSIDTAFFELATNRNIIDPLKNYKELNFTPFDPSTRRTEAKLLYQGREIIVMKGAVNQILSFCEISDENKEIMLKQIESNAVLGQRSIGVAMKDGTEKFKFIGVVGLSDMPSEDSKALIEELRTLGVKVVMLTGDALPIAKEISKQINLGENIVNLQGLTNTETRLDDIKLEDLDLDNTHGFAEIFPADKYFIVKAFQKRKAIVGMIGDGISDAPAIKQAEVGIAVSNAADICKDAASVVFLEEGLFPIIRMIKVGRQIHQRIVTLILNKIAKTLQSVVLVVIAFLIWKEFIISAFNMILLMFLVDFVTIALANDISRPSNFPEDWDMIKLAVTGSLIGTLTCIESLLLLYVALDFMGLSNYSVNTLQTFGFEILFFFGLTTVYILRERSFFWKSRPSYFLIIVGIIDSALVILFSTFGITIAGLDPLPIEFTGLVIGWAMVSNLINDLIKVLIEVYFRERKRKRETRANNKKTLENNGNRELLENTENKELLENTENKETSESDEGIENKD